MSRRCFPLMKAFLLSLQAPRLAMTEAHAHVPKKIITTGVAFGNLVQSMRPGSNESVAKVKLMTEAFAREVRKDRTTFPGMSQNGQGQPLTSQEDAQEFYNGLSRYFFKASLSNLTLRQSYKCCSTLSLPGTRSVGGAAPPEHKRTQRRRRRRMRTR